jgi:hypothetical protein
MAPPAAQHIHPLGPAPRAIQPDPPVPPPQAYGLAGAQLSPLSFRLPSQLPALLAWAKAHPDPPGAAPQLWMLKTSQHLGGVGVAQRWRGQQAVAGVLCRGCLESHTVLREGGRA